MGGCCSKEEQGDLGAPVSYSYNLNKDPDAFVLPGGASSVQTQFQGALTTTTTPSGTASPEKVDDLHKDDRELPEKPPALASSKRSSNRQPSVKRIVCFASTAETPRQPSNHSGDPAAQLDPEALLPEEPTTAMQAPEMPQEEQSKMSNNPVPQEQEVAKGTPPGLGPTQPPDEGPNLTNLQAVSTPPPPAPPQPAGTAAKMTRFRKISAMINPKKQPEQHQTLTQQPPVTLQEHQQQPNNAIDWEGLVRNNQINNLIMLKEDLETNFERFVLNQLIMSLQFWTNFDRDCERWARGRAAMDSTRNARLVNCRRKTSSMNRLFRHVQENVAILNKARGTLEPFLPVTNYIFNDNIEIYRQEEYDRLNNGSLQYSLVDGPLYRFCLEPSKDLGYVKLVYVADQSQCGSSAVSLKEELVYDEYDDYVPDPPADQQVLRQLENRFDVLPVPQGHPRGRRQVSSSSEADLQSDYQPYSQRSGDEGFSSSQSGLESDYEVVRVRDFRNSSHNQGNGIIGHSASLLSLSNHRRWSWSTLPPSCFRKQKPEDKPAAADRRSSSTSTGRPGSSYGGDYFGDFPDDYDLGTGSRRQPPRCPGGSKDAWPLTYLSSKQFMLYFESIFSLVLQQLDQEQLAASAKVLPPRMMCRSAILRQGPQEGGGGDHVDWHHRDLGVGVVLPHQRRYVAVASGRTAGPPARLEEWQDFVPSLQMAFWPDEALEWCLRERPAQRDKRTEVMYQWPSSGLVMACRQCGCNLVPVGHLPPVKKLGKAAKVEMASEWRLDFAKAEHLLLRSLNQPQLRCYLYLVLLLRKQLDTAMASGLPPVPPTYDLSDCHIRHLMFWMIEEAPADWQDETLGSNAITFLTRLRKQLSAGQLPNFFVRTANMFSSIPRHRLRLLEEKVFRIREDVVLNLVAGIRELCYAEGHDFYPAPDLNRLIHILTVEDTASLRISHELVAFMEGPNSANRRKVAGSSTVGLKIGANDTYRTNSLLVFFAEHFAQMAKASIERRSYGQALMYAMQAENFAVFLGDDSKQAIDIKEGTQSLRQLLPGCASQDYWQMNYGNSQDIRGMATRKTSSSNSFGSDYSVRHHQKYGPLPDLPPETKPKGLVTQASSENDTASVMTLVEVHHPDRAD